MHIRPLRPAARVPVVPRSLERSGATRRGTGGLAAGPTSGRAPRGLSKTGHPCVRPFRSPATYRGVRRVGYSGAVLNTGPASSRARPAENRLRAVACSRAGMTAALPTGYQHTANKTRFSMVPNGHEWSGRFRRKPCSDCRLPRFLPVFKEWRRGESKQQIA
jgi:hypothetical protein